MSGGDETPGGDEGKTRTGGPAIDWTGGPGGGPRRETEAGGRAGGSRYRTGRAETTPDRVRPRFSRPRRTTETVERGARAERETAKETGARRQWFGQAVC